MGVSNVECSTVVILTACSNCTTLGSSRQIPAKIASPLGEAIITALHKATEDVDHPVKCGTISIPQMFNGTMRFFVANIAEDIFSAPLNMKSVIHRLQTLRMFYDLDYCDRHPENHECDDKAANLRSLCKLGGQLPDHVLL